MEIIKSKILESMELAENIGSEVMDQEALQIELDFLMDACVHFTDGFGGIFTYRKGGVKVFLGFVAGGGLSGDGRTSGLYLIKRKLNFFNQKLSEIFIIIYLF